MKVTNIEPIVIAAQLDKPWKIGTAVFRTMSATLVRVETDEGISGIGECLTRFAPEAAAAVVEKILKPVVIDQDPFEVELIWDKMYGVMRGRGHSKGFVLEAMSGVDIALWTSWAKPWASQSTDFWEATAGLPCRFMPRHFSLNPRRYSSVKRRNSRLAGTAR